MSEEYGDYSIDDEDQLQPIDTLDDRGVEDTLDEGVVTRDNWSAAQRYGNTAEEQRRGNTLDERLREEEPDPDLDAEWEDDDSEGGDQVGHDRSGRLVAPDEGLTDDDEAESIAMDVGIDGAGASAEEAAMHIVDLEEADD